MAVPGSETTGARPGRVLVPGATGFFGGWIVRALEDAGHEVFGFGRDRLDLSDPEAVRRTVADIRPDLIVNAAGSASPGACRADPAACFTANTAAVFNLLEAARVGAPGCRTVLLSSAAVYGPGAGRPLDEEEPPAPGTVYGAAKLAAEILAGRYVRAGQLRITTLRVFNLVGPGQPADQAAAEFAREVRGALDAGLSEATVTVGDTAIERDFTDVRDAAAAVAAVAAAPRTADRVLNLCSGRTVSLSALAATLARLARRQDPAFSFDLREDPGRLAPGNPRALGGSPARLWQLTGWSARTPLGRSLADLLETLPEGS